VSYTVIDRHEASINASQTINVTAVNDIPVLGSGSVNLTAGTEDTPYIIQTSDLLKGFSDVDGDVLQLANVTADNGAVIVNDNGSYTFTPNPNYNGLVTLSYTVIDGKGGNINATQRLTLAAVNDAPVIKATKISTTRIVEDAAAVFIGLAFGKIAVATPRGA
jgi:hypothetical protein